MDSNGDRFWYDIQKDLFHAIPKSLSRHFQADIGFTKPVDSPATTGIP
jgi:hypothetical protein